MENDNEMELIEKLSKFMKKREQLKDVLFLTNTNQLYIYDIKYNSLSSDIEKIKIPLDDKLLVDLRNLQAEFLNSYLNICEQKITELKQQLLKGK